MYVNMRGETIKKTFEFHKLKNFFHFSKYDRSKHKNMTKSVADLAVFTIADWTHSIST